MNDMEPEITSLKELGLTENQAKCIIGMLKIGIQSDATTIAKISNIPRSKIYLILQQLHEFSLIDTFQIEGGTNLYKCRKVDHIIDKLTEIRDDKISQISTALGTAEESLRLLENSQQEELNEKLDFIAIKGRERIIEQICELIDKFKNSSIPIIVNLPYITFKPVCKAIIEKLIDIKKSSGSDLSLNILVNEEEFIELNKFSGFNILKEHILAIKFPIKDKDSSQKLKLPIKEPSGNFLTNLSNIFESRPFFMIVGTEAAFIIVENDYNSTALRIQNKIFLQFQQDIIYSLLVLIKQFGKNAFLMS